MVVHSGRWYKLSLCVCAYLSFGIRYIVNLYQKMLSCELTSELQVKGSIQVKGMDDATWNKGFFQMPLYYNLSLKEVTAC